MAQAQPTSTMSRVGARQQKKRWNLGGALHQESEDLNLVLRGHPGSTQGTSVFAQPPPLFLLGDALPSQPPSTSSSGDVDWGCSLHVTQAALGISDLELREDGSLCSVGESGSHQ